MDNDVLPCPICGEPGYRLERDIYRDRVEITCGNTKCPAYWEIMIDAISWNVVARHAIELREDTARLREALQFYADGMHYESDVNWCEDGAIARKALEE